VRSHRRSSSCSLLALPGTCNTAQISECVVRTKAQLVPQPLSSDDEEVTTGESLLHYFFKVELADGDVYAVDLCMLQFAFTSGEQYSGCVAPLQEHLQRLLLREKGEVPDKRVIIKPLGYHREEVKGEDAVSTFVGDVSGPGVDADEIGRDSVTWFTDNRASKQLDEVNRHWKQTQSTTLSKVLRLPQARFAHTFCTIVWPSEYMEAQTRSRLGSIFAAIKLMAKCMADPVMAGFLG
jgi:hypothetical protein